MPSALRELFVTIIMFCMPANPQELFDKHHLEWVDDYLMEATRKSITLTDKQLRTKVLLDLKQRLNARDRELKHFKIMEPTETDLEDISFTEKDTLPVLIKEELEFDFDTMCTIVEDRQLFNLLFGRKRQSLYT